MISERIIFVSRGITVPRIILKTRNTKKGKMHKEMALHSRFTCKLYAFCEAIIYISMAVLCPFVFYDTPKR